jgi:hypothetical protein
LQHVAHDIVAIGVTRRLLNEDSEGGRGALSKREPQRAHGGHARSAVGKSWRPLYATSNEALATSQQPLVAIHGIVAWLLAQSDSLRTMAIRT